jgi:hypothetical protein
VGADHHVALGVGHGDELGAVALHVGGHDGLQAVQIAGAERGDEGALLGQLLAQLEILVLGVLDFLGHHHLQGLDVLLGLFLEALMHEVAGGEEDSHAGDGHGGHHHDHDLDEDGHSHDRLLSGRNGDSLRLIGRGGEKLRPSRSGPAETGIRGPATGP